MRSHPPLPRFDDLPDGDVDDLLDGHLWLLELIDGADLRFQLHESGLVRFGDRDRVYDDPGDLPPAYRHAVRHVRDRLDRDALRRAVDDVTDIVFFGVATHRHAIDYDWERMPSFLGVDVWSADAGTFRPPDAAEAIFEGIGLDAVNAFERERHARDFDPDTYEIPRSAWTDTPAAGVVVRNKRGARAALIRSDPETDHERPISSIDGDGTGGLDRSAGTEATAPAGSTVTEPAELGVAELAETYATRSRFERIVADLEELERPVTAEALGERAVEEALREVHHTIGGTGGGGTGGGGTGGGGTREAFSAEVDARARAFVDDRDIEEW